MHPVFATRSTHENLARTLDFQHSLQTPLHAPQPPSSLLQLIALSSVLPPLPRLIRTPHRILLPLLQRYQISFQVRNRLLLGWDSGPQSSDLAVEVGQLSLLLGE